MAWQGFSWTPENVSTLRSLWIAGCSASKIAEHFNKRAGGGRVAVTRNAIIGKVHRLGLNKHHPHPQLGARA